MKALFLKMSLRERLLAGVIALLLVWSFISMVFSPQIRELKRLFHEKTVLQQVLQNRGDFPAGVGGAASAPPSAETGVSAPLSMIVSELARLVESHQLALLSVKPAPPEDKGDYWEYKISIDLNGRYRNVVEFLDKMEQLPRWMMVSDVRIEENVDQFPGVVVHLSTIVFEEKSGA